ncbi:MAG: hypothetical protein COV47_01450 [Candidatus Diapherotrites archaeon CG11_big_fil_rev_8_21_14_0_20_37_9]|nr:MAG: hypothetical protein COV47_01450 [Candidatus Diapherotrites archaeon CG11_big_fil_rev_8_21_14_0_20_37_9]
MVDWQKTAEFVAKKHNLSILRTLINGQQGLGFNSIMNTNTGITPRILSTRLKELEKSGLIQKNLVLGTKPKIEYLALPKAQGLKKIISELDKWGQKEL